MMYYFEGCQDTPDFHATVSIQLCELIEGGFFKIPSKEWHFPKYSNEQNRRLCKKITDHFYYREIGVLPAGKWKREFLRKLNEIMPKYIPLYEMLDKGVNILQTQDVYGKNRDIYSEFPATMLGDNQDYASTGNDREFENITEGDWMERAMTVEERYNDVDVMIINELECMFSCLLTVSVNGY